MEEYIKQSLNLIEDFRVAGLATLPSDLESTITNIESYAKSYNPLLVVVSLIIIVYTLTKSGPYLRMLLDFETYSLYFFRLLGKLGILNSKMNNERAKILELGLSSFKIDKYDNKLSIQQNSQDINRILTFFEEYSSRDKLHFSKENKQTGCIYANSKDLDALAEKAAELYAYTDLNNCSEIFPSIKRIENNLLDIMLGLFNGDADSCGITSTGGTESIMQMMYAAKIYGIEKGINEPEVIVPITAHAAFDKGCQTYGLKLVKVGLDSDYKVNISKVKSSINKNTVCLVGSATNFPHGIIDDIQELGKLAVQNKLLLHVDGCLGGFLTCFFSEFNKDWAPLDFKVPGVTSISCDIHKYGMTQKGVSVLLLKNKKIRNLLSFGSVGTDGITTSPTLSSNRSAYLVVSGFMTLIHIGKKTYIEQAKKIHLMVLKIKSELSKFPGIKVVGDPMVSIFAITGDRIGQIHQEMKNKGWAINFITSPMGLAFCITSANLPLFEKGKFIEDFRESYNYIVDNNIKKESGLAAMYGVAAMLPEEVVNKNLDILLDCFVDTKESLTSRIQIK